MRQNDLPVQNRSELIIERLPNKIDWKLHGSWGDRRDDSAEKQILSAAAAAGITPFNPATMPTLKGPYTTGRKLNVARFVQGEDRCMIRDVGRHDPTRSSGVRIFVQLAAIWYEKHEDILRRAVSALALADRVRSDGRPVEVLATWCVRGDADNRRASMLWQPITDASAKQLADLTDPKFLRSVILGYYDSDRCEARRLGAIGRLYGLPVTRFDVFKTYISALKQDGDIAIDWTKGSIQDQIDNGMEQL